MPGPMPPFRSPFGALAGFAPFGGDPAQLLALSPLAGLAAAHAAAGASNWAPPNPPGHELSSNLDQYVKLLQAMNAARGAGSGGMPGGGNPLGGLGGGNPLGGFGGGLGGGGPFAGSSGDDAMSALGGNALDVFGGGMPYGALGGGDQLAGLFGAAGGGGDLLSALMFFA